VDDIGVVQRVAPRWWIAWKGIRCGHEEYLDSYPTKHEAVARITFEKKLEKKSERNEGEGA
jgi:hypothetical protein